MTHDDAFLTRLRTLADDTPDVPLDRDRVLHLGRRRRARLATGVATLTVAGLALASTGVAALVQRDGGSALPAGPTASAAPSPSASPDPSPGQEVPHAVIDPVAGTIGLPLDEWIWSPAEQATSETAVELAAAQCMAAQGLGEEFVFGGPMPVQPDRLTYGVWQREVVEATGYGSLVPDDDRPGTGLRGDDPRVQTQRDCYAAAFATYSYDPETFQNVAPTGVESPAYLPAGQALLAEWAACIAEEGVAPPAELTWPVPEGATTMPMAEQVRVGLIDVGCKEELDFVQRYADVDAAEQVAYIERARPFLVELRAAEDRALAASRALLIANGVPIPGE